MDEFKQDRQVTNVASGNQISNNMGVEDFASHPSKPSHLGILRGGEGSTSLSSSGFLRERFSCYTVTPTKRNYEPYQKLGTFMYWETVDKPRLPFTERTVRGLGRACDKVSLGLDRIYFNEDRIGHLLKVRDWVTTRVSNIAFIIDFHSEFFRGEGTMWEEMLPVLVYLFEAGYFRVPVCFQGRSGKKQNWKDFGIKELPCSGEEMLELVLSRLVIREAELRFDFPVGMADMPGLPRNFKAVGTTMYSPDARVAKRGRKSLVCVYDRGGKNREEGRGQEGALTRVEFRLTGDLARKSLDMNDLRLDLEGFLTRLEEKVGGYLRRKRKYRLRGFLGALGLGYLLEAGGDVKSGFSWRFMEFLRNVVERLGSLEEAGEMRGGYIKADPQNKLTFGAAVVSSGPD